MLFHDLILLQNLYFNQCKLFWSNSLPLCSVMISAHLLVFWWKYWRSFTEVDISSFLEFDELPLDEWIIIWVHICRYERSCVINMNSKSFQMFLSQWREIFYPESGVFELLNIFLGYVHILQYSVLSSIDWCSFREFWWASICLKLVCKF
jgi:hypothetical protein